jgi:CHAT domain-containing protein
VTQPIIGDVATIAEFQKMTGDYDTIHLIAHIDHDKNNPEISRILLGHGKDDEGAMETSQVASLDLR